VIKKFRVELIILGILFLSIFVSYNIDIGLYYFFKNLNGSLQNIFLKEFFEQITVLGDSKWYFILSIVIIVFFHLVKNISHLSLYKQIIRTYLNFGYLLFLSLIVTGLITQLLKHIVGRARPNHASLDDFVDFNFFNLSSEYHSFPSGHTSTVFVVALVVIFFQPKLKYFVLCLATLIAFSRVVVGAHFFTDVIGGIVVSYIGIKLTKLFFNKYYPIQKSEEGVLTYKNKFYLSLFVFLSLVIFLSVGQSLDIYLSSLFYYGEGQFLLQSYYNITIFFRKIILPLIIIYLFILPIVSFFLPIKNIYMKYKFSFKEIIFLWISGVFNLWIIVNLFLKNIWGRARPGDILQLGGKESFSPWYQITDACNSNCSFVSGDAAVGFSIVVFYFLTKKEIYFWISLFFGFSLGLIRVMEGGHFVSDIVMAATILYLSYFFQTKYYFNKYD